MIKKYTLQISQPDALALANVLHELVTSYDVLLRLGLLEGKDFEEARDDLEDLWNDIVAIADKNG